ncbi:MAG: AbrB/MazE/SpoVT family DNA-binding domain-containing protein [Cyanobacteria bacterium P01_D01_bin.56]
MYFHGKISDRGRIVVPAQLRRSLGLNSGDDIVLREHNGGLHVISLQQAIKRVQHLAREKIPSDVNLTSELLKDRRAEVQKEEETIPSSSRTAS